MGRATGDRESDTISKYVACNKRSVTWHPHSIHDAFLAGTLGGVRSGRSGGGVRRLPKFEDSEGSEIEPGNTLEWLVNKVDDLHAKPVSIGKEKKAKLTSVKLEEMKWYISDKKEPEPYYDAGIRPSKRAVADLQREESC